MAQQAQLLDDRLDTLDRLIVAREQARENLNKARAKLVVETRRGSREGSSHISGNVIAIAAAQARLDAAEQAFNQVRNRVEVAKHIIAGMVTG